MTFLEISPADSPLVIGLPHTGLDLPEDVRDALNVSCGTIRLPASGVWRHADAGYEAALDCAKTHGLRPPGILGN
jgi:urocanate hydratase